MDQKKWICQGLPDAVDKQTPNSLYTPYHPRIEKITLAVHIAVFFNGKWRFVLPHRHEKPKNLASSSPRKTSHNS